MRAVHRPPVLRQERLPLAIGQGAEDTLRVERILPLRRLDGQSRHAPMLTPDHTCGGSATLSCLATNQHRGRHLEQVT